MRVAAIDCGTNSTRLLIAESSTEPRGFTILDRRMRITRLGQGVNATKLLAPEAIERTADVLREYRAAMDELGVERVRITATSA
ncbi:MAG: exopolyphosphatase / guanosine-5-triphosphate,3-diphosphate pyrophosphatase, partial [Acidimicrobiaceae bacterium]